LQISSLSARFADPQKILKRLSSLSFGERFRSVAVFAVLPSGLGAVPSPVSFGAG
jgi:hypothetical protein